MSKKITHTPGPWEVASDGINIVSTGKLKKRFIAEALESTVMGGDKNGVYVKNDLELEANARLIAAAPELLKAAKYAMQRIGELEPENKKWDLAYETLQAAIAKAEGR